MHEKFDLGGTHVPSLNVGLKRMKERVECLQEELKEFADAVADGDLPAMADALIDLTVFAKGTAVLMGLPWACLFDDVMRANNAKVRGVGHRGHQVDLVKPPGWRGPQTEVILKAYGWTPPDCEHCNDRGCPLCNAGGPVWVGEPPSEEEGDGL